MNNWIQFKVIGETIIIDARRLPQIYVYRYFNVEKREWDMPLLKLAAHLMSDEIIMVKAIFDEKPEGTTLSFFIVVLDGIFISFRNNLMTYLSIIREGWKRMNEIHISLVDEKMHTLFTVDTLSPVTQQEEKILS